MAILRLSLGRQAGPASLRLAQGKGCMNDVGKGSRAGAATSPLPAEASRPAASQGAGTSQCLDRGSGDPASSQRAKGKLPLLFIFPSSPPFHRLPSPRAPSTYILSSYLKYRSEWPLPIFICPLYNRLNQLIWYLHFAPARNSLGYLASIPEKEISWH